MADTVEVVCTRPEQNQTITVTIPESVVQMLDVLAASTKAPDGAAYLYGMNVIWKNVILLLLPMWQEQYIALQTAPLQDQIAAARQQISTAIAEGVAAMTVVGP